MTDTYVIHLTEDQLNRLADFAAEELRFWQKVSDQRQEVRRDDLLAVWLDNAEQWERLLRELEEGGEQ